MPVVPQQRRGSGAATRILDHATDRRRGLLRHARESRCCGPGVRAWRHEPTTTGRREQSRARAATVQGNRSDRPAIPVGAPRRTRCRWTSSASAATPSTVRFAPTPRRPCNTGFRQARVAGTTFEVKTQGDPTTVVPEIRDVVRGIDPHLHLGSGAGGPDQRVAAKRSG
jgi:hypothetical protein